MTRPGCRRASAARSCSVRTPCSRGLRGLITRMNGLMVTVPVIAAGGIGDGRGVAAALTLGASAVQLGSAYLHTPEALVSDAHRAALINGRTLFTNLMTGGLARLVDELGPVRTEVPPYPLASAALAPIRDTAEKRGEYSFGPMWAGQAAPLGQALPAADLTRKLAAEALAILRAAA